MRRFDLTGEGFRELPRLQKFVARRAPVVHAARLHEPFEVVISPGLVRFGEAGDYLLFDAQGRPEIIKAAAFELFWRRAGVNE